MTSIVSSVKKPQPSSHPLTALQANTTTTLPHNLKFQQQPNIYKLAKLLKENVDTTTTTTITSSSNNTSVSAASHQTSSSNGKSKGNINKIVVRYPHQNQSNKNNR